MTETGKINGHRPSGLLHLLDPSLKLAPHPQQDQVDFDLESGLSAVVRLSSNVPEEAFSARINMLSLLSALRTTVCPKCLPEQTISSLKKMSFSYILLSTINIWVSFRTVFSTAVYRWRRCWSPPLLSGGGEWANGW